MSLVPVADFQDPFRTLVLTSALDAAGIYAHVPDYIFHTYYPFLAIGFTGSRVLVLEADIDAARQIAALDLRDGPLVPCPVCAGHTWKLKTRGGVLALAALLALSIIWSIWVLIVPPRLMRSRICESCGHRYRPERPDPITAEEAGYTRTKSPAG